MRDNGSRRGKGSAEDHHRLWSQISVSASVDRLSKPDQLDVFESVRLVFVKFCCDDVYRSYKTEGR